MLTWLLVCLSIAACTVVYFLLRKTPPCPSATPLLKPPTEEAHIHGDKLACTCDDWKAHRTRYGIGDPRRLCVHLCEYLSADILRIPEKLIPFAQIICSMHEKGEGVPCNNSAFAFVVGETGYFITMPPEQYPWVDVQVGHNVFGYNIEENRWTSQGMPPFAKDIGKLITAEAKKRALVKKGFVKPHNAR